MITLAPICNEKEAAAALSANKTLIQCHCAQWGGRKNI